MIICSSNNIDFIQGVIAYGNEPLITDWRIANSNGVLNILNSKSNNGNLSILENGNVSIGTSMQSGTLNVYGDVDITGGYKKNGRDIINDTSNYVLSTSNILINRIINTSNYADKVGEWSSNYISRLSFSGGGGTTSQWTSVASGIYYNTSNVGIGTILPTSKLHIYDNINNNTKLTIENINPVSVPITSTPIPTTIGTAGIYTYIVFTYTTETGGAGSGQTIYTINIPTGGVNCEILMVGGGGAGGQDIGAGGGGGAVLYGSNITIASGSYPVYVGRGANVGETRGKSTTGFGATILGGGCAGNQGWSSAVTRSGNSGGSGGGVGGQQVGNPIGTRGGVGVSTKGAILTNATLYNGNQGGAGTNPGPVGIQSAGGGGAGSVGGDGTGGGTASGNGGNGVLVNITGANHYWGGGGGGGGYNSTATNGGLGGGGAGAKGEGGGSTVTYGSVGGSSYTTPVLMNAGAHTGGGGGGAAFQVTTAGLGGSGIVIIKYYTSETSTTIELLRGGTTDRDYKLGNYNGDFKIISSVNTIDTDYVKITSTGAIYNPTGTSSWTTTSDRRIKENIEEASYNKCYDNINSLGLYRFNYVEGFNNVNKDIKQLGFIAQEVNEFFPKAVSSYNFNNNDLFIPDLLSIDITQINYSLYGAVKKLIKQNEDKGRRIKRLETLLNIEDEPIDTSNIALDTSNIALDTSNIALDTSNIAIDTSNIAIDTSNIAIDTSNIALDTSNIAIDTSNISVDTSNISVDTSNLPIDTSNIAIDTSNISIDTSNLPIDTSNIALDTSNIDQTTSNLNSDTSNIAIYTSNIDQTTSNLNSNTSNIPTE